MMGHCWGSSTVDWGIGTVMESSTVPSVGGIGAVLRV